MSAVILCRIFVIQFGIKNMKITMYKTIILPLSLYECQTWSVMLREEHMLELFDN